MVSICAVGDEMLAAGHAADPKKNLTDLGNPKELISRALVDSSQTQQHAFSTACMVNILSCLPAAFNCVPPGGCRSGMVGSVALLQSYQQSTSPYI